MKYLIIIALFLSVFQLQAQNQDTLVSVNFFGTHYAVQNHEALSMPELKKLTKPYPEARKAFVKARNIRHLQIAINILSIVPLVYGLSSTDENAMLLGLGASVLMTTIEVSLLQTPFNKHLDRSIELYNKKE
jgi:hypothetical protein